MSTRVRCNSRVKLAGVFIVLAVTASCLSGCAPVYSCPAEGAHCYGTTTLPLAQTGTTSFLGFATQVTGVPLNSGNGELNNEIWVVQYKNTACGNLGDQCWIEIGLSAGADEGGCSLPADETHVFWADNRPNNGFYCHDQGPLQAQELNHSVFLMIRPHSSQVDTFDVDAQTCADVGGSGACAQRWITGISGNNSMVASDIIMGTELSGTTGASASKANFTGTVVLDPSAPFGGRYLTSDGNITLNAPVNAGWTASPSTSNFGGSFFTACCQ